MGKIGCAGQIKAECGIAGAKAKFIILKKKHNCNMKNAGEPYIKKGFKAKNATRESGKVKKHAKKTPHPKAGSKG